MGMVGWKDKLLFTWGKRSGGYRESGVQPLYASTILRAKNLEFGITCWMILNIGVPCQVTACFFSLIGAIISERKF